MRNLIHTPFRYSYFSANLILIGFNIIFFTLTSSSYKLLSLLGMNAAEVIYGHKFWQPLTYMFVHGNMRHLLSNMIELIFFGTAVERAIGSKEYLLMYLLCGLLSGLASLGYFYWNGDYFSLLIGASGAVYTIMFAFAVIFPKSMILLFFIIPIPAPILVILYTAFELFSEMNSLQAGVAHYTHLFGFLAAFFYFIIRMGINPLKIWAKTYF